VSGLNDGSGSFSPATIDLPQTFQSNDCTDGICPVTDATITQNNETTNFVGIAVLKNDFFAYQLIQTPNSATNTDGAGDPLLIFGGKGYNFGQPSGKTYTFVLTPDLRESIQGAFAPFSGGGSSPVVNPEGPTPSISPLLYLEKDSASASDQSRAVWLQTSFYINTTPQEGDTNFDQQSFINVRSRRRRKRRAGRRAARRGERRYHRGERLRT
jgi:hypothetical protein